MQRPRKINVILFAKSIDAGTGKYFQDLQGLVAYNINIKNLVLQKPRYRKQYPNALFYGIYHKTDRYTVSSMVMGLIREVIWFKKAVKVSPTDLIITIDLHTMLVSQICKALFGFNYKTISTIHNNLPEVIKLRVHPLFRLLTKKAIAYFLKKSDSAVTVSKSLSIATQSYLSLKKVPNAIYNGVTPPKNHHKKLRSAKVILSIGRFDAQKDFVNLIRAFAELVKTNKETKLILAGDGNQKHKIQKMIKKFNLEKRIKLTGWHQNPQKLYSKSDIFVLSSKWEGFPYVLLEAMSFGLPVISTNCPFGPSELLGLDKYGLLVPMGDYKTMANTISKLINSNTLLRKYSRLSLKRSKEFNVKNMLEKYKNLILKIVNNNQNA